MENDQEITPLWFSAIDKWVNNLEEQIQALKQTPASYEPPPFEKATKDEIDAVLKKIM